jgi:hypothetical protein
MKLCINKKKEKIIDLHSDTNLPKHGWIQGCISCYQKTSKTTFYKKIGDHKYNYTFNIYLCKECIKLDPLSDNKFLEILDKIINNEYL